MAATPRAASTVILTDDSSRVYFTKRPKTMKVLGGYAVFPGGKVDKGDYNLEKEQLTRNKLNQPVHHSYYAAAARELFEEIGILLLAEDSGKTLSAEKETEYRRLLINGEITFMEMVKEEGLQIDLSALKYLGQIITPEFYPVRFDTRFFLAKLPKRQTPKPHPQEIDSAFWLHPEAALRKYEYGKIQFAPPTLHILKTLQSYKKGQALIIPEFNVFDYIISAE